MRPKTMERAWSSRRGASAVVIALVVALVALTATSDVWAAGKASAGKKAAAEAATDATASAKPDTVHVSIQTVPPRKAQVKWGRKSLGTIPVPRALVIERPRDSGPMDLVIRASGYLPVHTRAYTFNDSRVAVKLTPPSEKNKLFGFKQEIVPSPDAGVPPPPVEPLRE